MLKTFAHRIYISPGLSPSEIELENKLLKKRRSLITEGVEKKRLKLRNLKLLLDDEEVKIDS